MTTTLVRNTLSTVMTPSGRALRTPPPVAAVAFVPSDSRPALRHAVMRAVDSTGAETWGCSCEAGSFRPDRECKHVRAVRAVTVPPGTQWTPEGCVITGQVLGD